MSRRWQERYRYGLRGLRMVVVLFLLLLILGVYAHYFLRG
jgi:hypothetical protein